MGKVITFLLLVQALSSLNAQQSSSLDFFNMTNYTKVFILHYHVQDKTDNTPNSKVFYSKKLIGEETLTKKEIAKFFKEIKRKSISAHVLDTHDNIIINFYLNKKIIQYIKISQHTNNIIIKTENCKKILIDGVETDPCLYLGQTTPKFSNYISRLLKKKRIIK